MSIEQAEVILDSYDARLLYTYIGEARTNAVAFSHKATFFENAAESVLLLFEAWKRRRRRKVSMSNKREFNFEPIKIVKNETSSRAKKTGFNAVIPYS